MSVMGSYERCGDAEYAAGRAELTPAAAMPGLLSDRPDGCAWALP